jgi:hypothetical protein
MNYRGVELGAVLAGRYRIDRVLGQGGMGIVVQAMHLQLHQPVAMKFLLPEVLGNQQVVQRFLREAQAAVRLRSEHVARVIDVGTLETGAPYMVLEYLEGADLANFPRSQLSIGGVVDLMLQACEALAEAHSLGIVHRDIKPANFFLARGADGAPLLKVLDFGISKAPTAGTNLTATQSVMGTPAYMSPEQMRSSRDVDNRSDIWALGVVLYELLQGVPPFGGDTFSSMVLKVVNDPLPRMTVHLPGELDAIPEHRRARARARTLRAIADPGGDLGAAHQQHHRHVAVAARDRSRDRPTPGAVDDLRRCRGPDDAPGPPALADLRLARRGGRRGRRDRDRGFEWWRRRRRQDRHACRAARLQGGERAAGNATRCADAARAGSRDHADATRAARRRDASRAATRCCDPARCGSGAGGDPDHGDHAARLACASCNPRRVKDTNLRHRGEPTEHCCEEAEAEALHACQA